MYEADKVAPIIAMLERGAVALGRWGAGIRRRRRSGRIRHTGVGRLRVREAWKSEENKHQVAATDHR